MIFYHNEEILVRYNSSFMVVMEQVLLLYTKEIDNSNYNCICIKNIREIVGLLDCLPSIGNVFKKVYRFGFGEKSLVPNPNPNFTEKKIMIRTRTRTSRIWPNFRRTRTRTQVRGNPNCK